MIKWIKMHLNYLTDLFIHSFIHNSLIFNNVFQQYVSYALDMRHNGGLWAFTGLKIGCCLKAI